MKGVPLYEKDYKGLILYFIKVIYEVVGNVSEIMGN